LGFRLEGSDLEASRPWCVCLGGVQFVVAMRYACSARVGRCHEIQVCHKIQVCACAFACAFVFLCLCGGVGTHAAHVRQDDAELGGWTRNLRLMFKRKRLSLDQVSTLRKIGFCFDGYTHIETVVKTEGKSVTTVVRTVVD
jgi:hypothetical protein